VLSHVLELEVEGDEEVHHGLEHHMIVVELAVTVQQDGQIQLLVLAQRARTGLASQIIDHLPQICADHLHSFLLFVLSLDYIIFLRHYLHCIHGTAEAVCLLDVLKSDFRCRCRHNCFDLSIGRCNNRL
jgi:hypothetical protein